MAIRRLVYLLFILSFVSILSMYLILSKPVLFIKNVDVNEIFQSDGSNSNHVRVFCFIKSYLKNYRNYRAQTVYKIWGRKCDDYRIIMMIPQEFRPKDWELGKEVEIEEPLKILQPKTLKIEIHSGITSKIFHAFISIYKRFPDYHWYYLVDDDSYVNMNNLRSFLSTKNYSELITYGYDYKVINFVA